MLVMAYISSTCRSEMFGALVTTMFDVSVYIRNVATHFLTNGTSHSVGPGRNSFGD